MPARRRARARTRADLRLSRLGLRQMREGEDGYPSCLAPAAQMTGTLISPPAFDGVHGGYVRL